LIHLTVLYPELNRFDKANGNVPFSSTAGDFFKHRTFDTIPGITLDVRLPGSYHTHLVPGTYILGIGPAACKVITGDPNVHKQRGYRKFYLGHPAIATYDHLSCWEFNSEDEEKESTDDKDVGVTRKANYFFWALADFRKLLTPPRPHSKHIHESQPNLSKIIHLLDKAPTGGVFVLDIETRIQDNCLDAIGIGYVGPAAVYTYSIPIYYHDNKAVYAARDMARFWRALYNFLLRKDITVVGHNLAFDLSILHYYYHLPIPPTLYDTMLFMHRDNANIDKSLSHAISYYTDAPENHKGDLCPNTSPTNFTQLLQYNGRDLYWTAEVYRRQREKISDRPGLGDAVSIANRAQFLCLLMSFTGIEVNQEALEKQKEALTLKLSQWDRVAAVLTGIPSFNCNSTKQVGEYFYDTLHYEILEYTDKGAPAADENTLYKLQLRQPNPLLALILAYRSAKKELGMLNFKPYEKFVSRV